MVDGLLCHPCHGQPRTGSRRALPCPGPAYDERRKAELCRLASHTGGGRSSSSRFSDTFPGPGYSSSTASASALIQSLWHVRIDRFSTAVMSEFRIAVSAADKNGNTIPRRASPGGQDFCRDVC